MIQAIHEFLRYLNDEYLFDLKLKYNQTNDNEEQKNLKKQIIKIKYLINMLSLPQDKWTLYDLPFYDFAMLSDLLLKSNLNGKKQLNIIKYLIKKNKFLYRSTYDDLNTSCDHYVKYKIKTNPFNIIETSASKKKYTCNVDNLIDYIMFNKSNTRRAQINAVFENHLHIKEDYVLYYLASYNYLLNIVQYRNTPTFKNIYKLLCFDIKYLGPFILNEFNRLKVNKVDITNLVDQVLKCEDKYLEDSFGANPSEINEFLLLLKNIGIDTSVLTKINTDLNKVSEKPEKTSEHKDSFLKGWLAINKEDSQQNNIYRNELTKYYDIETAKLKDQLSIQNVIYCIYLLKKLKYSNEVINQFIKVARNENNKQNIIDQYNYIIDKLKHYAVSLNLEDEINELEQYFREYNCASDEEKVIWAEFLEKSLNKLKQFIPNDGSYELEQASLLLSKNNQK